MKNQTPVLYQRLRIFSKTDLILSAAVHVKTPIREIITDLLPYVDKPVKTFLMGQSSERYDSFLLAGRNPFWFIDNKIGNDMNIIELRPRLLVALSQYDKIIILCIP